MGGSWQAPLAYRQFGSLNTGWLSQHFLGHSEYVLSCEFGDQVPHMGDSKSPSLYRLQGKAEFLSRIRWETEPRGGGACLTTQYPGQCELQPGA